MLSIHSKLVYLTVLNEKSEISPAPFAFCHALGSLLSVFHARKAYILQVFTIKGAILKQRALQNPWGWTAGPLRHSHGRGGVWRGNCSQRPHG